MTQAGKDANAQAMAAEQRTAVERKADAVLAKIGHGNEQTVAEIRLTAATEAETAKAVLGP